LAMSDSIILYAPHLIKYVPRAFRKKVFIANNTLNIRYRPISREMRHLYLSYYGIHTRKNIICAGRFHERKRVQHLVDAFNSMNRPDFGLILVGPDPDCTLANVQGCNIFKLGPIYGERLLDLLSAADICCIPGAVGLSVVDAFYCGLPLITEAGDESPEMMYVKHGINALVVPQAGVHNLAKALLLLLEDDVLRDHFSCAARREISSTGRIETMAAAFVAALHFATQS